MGTVDILADKIARKQLRESGNNPEKLKELEESIAAVETLPNELQVAEAEVKRLNMAINQTKLSLADYTKASAGIHATLSSPNTSDAAKMVMLNDQIANNSNIAAAQMQLDAYKSELKEAKAKLTRVKKQADAPVANDLNARVERYISDYNVRYITSIDKVVYCRSTSKDGINNPIFREVSPQNFVQVIRGHFKTTAIYPAENEDGKPCSPADNVRDSFIVNGYSREATTCSFNDSKWDNDRFYNKMEIIKSYWVHPDYDNAEHYDKRFDFLMDCVGNGKQENMDHLEQWIAYKYLYPERVANTPNLDIGGSPGGNGKGRYQSICQTIFTGSCVINAALKELMDGFNSGWEMAAFLVYDEPEQKELPASKLKQATGSEDLRSETKGVDAKMVDRNFNFLFLSNNQEGVVRLAGTGAGGEDRRYSVIITNKVMLTEAIAQGLAVKEDVLKFLNGVKELCQDREEVAKWLAHIILKHKLLTASNLPPLHGDDYKARFEDQKNHFDLAFDQILPVFESQGVIPYKVLTELAHGLGINEKVSPAAIAKKFKEYCIKKGVVCTTPNRQRCKLLWNGDLLWEMVNVSVLHSTTPANVFEMTKVTSKIPLKNEKLTDINLTGEAIEEAVAVMGTQTTVQTHSDKKQQELELPKAITKSDWLNSQLRKTLKE